ncbi:MAG: exodeoxyribonuclease VII small subunit [Lachnospiraceae bacterium]|nr:exodeoxyribonuclease VII small subunit [Lachnospiraceae bacterium]MBP5222155.1 exodeoxyribonuclease VII small subunit [Lachnospiraceae bacterium]
MPQKEKKNPSLEEQFEKLEQLIDILSDEEVSLEEAFSAYSKGMELLKNCQDQIDGVEKKVMLLGSNGVQEEFEAGEE